MEPQFSVVSYVFLLLPLAVLLAWAWTGVWAWRDAQRRGKPPALVALLVLLAAWPLGLLVWLMIRPDVQYIVNPGTFNYSGTDNAWAVGVQAKVTF